MYQDAHSKMKIVHGIAPAAIAGDTDSAIVDTIGFESLEWVLHVGIAMAGGGFTCVFEESDVVTFGGEETAVPTGEVVGASPVVAIADADKVFRVGIVGKKRFQRMSLVETGTITAGIIGVNAHLGNPEQAPVADQST